VDVFQDHSHTENSGEHFWRNADANAESLRESLPRDAEFFTQLFDAAVWATRERLQCQGHVPRSRPLVNEPGRQLLHHQVDSILSGSCCTHLLSQRTRMSPQIAEIDSRVSQVESRRLEELRGSAGFEPDGEHVHRI
jgi:hypothetical protein